MPSVISAKQQGYQTFFVPRENLYELEYISDITIIPLSHFSELLDFFLKGEKLAYARNTKALGELKDENTDDSYDFKYIKGHLFVKRALSIAAAGLHNVLMV